MLTRTIWLVVGSAFVGAALGAGLGGLLGKIAPGYYRGIFGHPSDDSFNPLQVGLGLGLTQGLIFGVVVGLAMAAIVAWHDVKTRTRD